MNPMLGVVMDEMFGRITGFALDPSNLIGLPSVVANPVPSLVLSKVYSGTPEIFDA